MPSFLFLQLIFQPLRIFAVFGVSAYLYFGVNMTWRRLSRRLLIEGRTD